MKHFNILVLFNYDLRKLENYEKTQKLVEAEPNIQSPFQKNLGTSGQKLH